MPRKINTKPSSAGRAKSKPSSGGIAPEGPAKPFALARRPPEPADLPKGYIDGVLSGKILVGRLVRLAVQRHVADLKDAAARGLHFDEAAGARAIRFFSFLRHSKGEWGRGGGQPFELSPWQAFILWCVFGWKRADGTRRYRVAYVEIARKNGKSTFAAGIGLYLLDADGEPGAEVYTAATKLSQARIVHADATRMVRKSPPLKRRVRIYKDNLHVESTASKFEPLCADGDSMDGLNVHGAIVDELHQHKTRAVWDALDTATGARRQPLIFAITTAGFNQQSICWEVREYAVRVLESQPDDPGVHDDSVFAFIATLDGGDDWRDESVWAKANPNLGVSVKLDDLRRKALIAQQQSGALNSFLTKHMDVWTRQKTLWLKMDKWDQPANSSPFVQGELLGRRCTAGLDLAKTGDLTALVLAFENEDGSFEILPHFWMPEERAEERSKAGQFDYLGCARRGLITLTAGDSTDYRFVRQRIVELWGQYDIASLAFDPWNARHLVTELIEEDGLPHESIVEFGQTIKNLNEPSQYLETLTNAGKLHHGGNPVLRWMAANVSVKTDPSGNIRPVKPDHLDPKKIDGIVALIMALGRAIVVANAGDQPLITVF